MAENSNKQPGINDSLNHMNLSVELTNLPTSSSSPPSTAENLREGGMPMDPDSEVSNFVDDQTNNTIHQTNDDSGGEQMGSEIRLEFSGDDLETNSWSSACEYDGMTWNVPVYYTGGLGDEAFRMGVGAGNVIGGDGISQDGGDVEMNVGLGETSEVVDGMRNLNAWGMDSWVEGVGERDGWGSIEENHGCNDDVLVFDFRGQGVVDLSPQVVVTVGGQGWTIGGRNIDSWIPELVERVSTLSLLEREGREWEERNIPDLHVNNGVDAAYYVGEYGMEFDEFLLESGAYGTPAAISAVEDLASLVITHENVKNDHVKCVVCIEEFEVGDIAKVLPCSHYFHESCILSWLRIQNTCPVCRRELPIDDPEYQGETNEAAAPLPNIDNNQ